MDADVHSELCAGRSLLFRPLDPGVLSRHLESQRRSFLTSVEQDAGDERPRCRHRGRALLSVRRSSRAASISACSPSIDPRSSCCCSMMRMLRSRAGHPSRCVNIARITTGMLRAGPSAGPGVRLPGARSLRPGPRAWFDAEKCCSTLMGLPWPSQNIRPPGCGAARRQCCGDEERRRRSRSVRLARRSAAQAGLCRDRDL